MLLFNNSFTDVNYSHSLKAKANSSSSEPIALAVGEQALKLNYYYLSPVIFYDLGYFKCNIDEFDFYFQPFFLLLYLQ